MRDKSRSMNTVNFTSPLISRGGELAAIRSRGKSALRKRSRRSERLSENLSDRNGASHLVCGLQLRKYTLSETFRRRARVGQPFLRTPA